MTFYGTENQKGLAPLDPMPSASGRQTASLPSCPSVLPHPNLPHPHSLIMAAGVGGGGGGRDTFLKSRLNQVLGQQMCECGLICASS